MFYTNIRSPVKPFLLGSAHDDRLGLDARRHRPRAHPRAGRAGKRAFYKTVLEPLGIPPIWESDRGAQLANLVVTDGEPTTSGPVHIAFVAESRELVDAFHRAGLEAGHRDNGPPGVREQYSSDEGGRYYVPSCSTPTATTSRRSIASSIE
jgi:hypothetical protein